EVAFLDGATSDWYRLQPDNSEINLWTENYFAARRRSRGVASHRNSALGGEMRFSFRAATPAFLSEVMGCLLAKAAAMSSSRCGAWPKRKTVEDCLSLASSRKSMEDSAPGKSKSVRRIFCFE